jgi:hypothetical protein
VEVGTRTRIRTGFADPGRQIDTETLREIYFAVRSMIADIGEQTWEALAVPAPEAVYVELYVELPNRYAEQLGRALDAIDLAWRLGWMVAEMEEAEVPSSGGSTNLDEFLSVESLGIEVEAIEIGSFKVRFKPVKMSFDRAIAVLGLVVSIGGFNINQAFSADAQPIGGGSCQVEVVGQLDEQAIRVIQDQLPGLPANCQVKMRITLPDGTVINANVPASALPDR